MDVLEIVQSAAFKSGVISSFNPDDLPGDILAAGQNALINEIIPSLNCDRTIDITVTSRIYRPENDRIILRPFCPKDNHEMLGYSNNSANDLLDPTLWEKAVVALRPEWKNDWPVNDLGKPRVGCIWSIDNQLIVGSSLSKSAIEPGVNIDFPPMRVDAVLDASTRIAYDFTYRTEFEQLLNTTLPGVYTVEEYADGLVILLRGTTDAKCVVLPVPLQVINISHDHAGTIVAPDKFRRYLIDSTAVSLAVIYGMSTLPAMQQQQAASYNLIKKNKPQPRHSANVAEQIATTLRRNIRLGGRFYERR